MKVPKFLHLLISNNITIVRILTIVVLTNLFTYQSFADIAYKENLTFDSLRQRSINFDRNLGTKAKYKQTMMMPIILFSEDFDDISGPIAGGPGTYTFPNGWFLRNVDNRAPDIIVSYINDAWERREDFSFNVTDSVAFSTSYTNPVGTGDDWMWTPLITGISSNTVLKWNATAYDPAFPDGYEVRIMTSAQGPPTGGNGDIGNQITNSTQVFSISAENTVWTERQQDISSFAGQNIYVGFRNNSNDKFILVIDDIVVESSALVKNVSTNTTYATLQDAVNDASSGDPIMLLDNISEAGLNITNSVIIEANAFTLTIPSGVLTIPLGESLIWKENSLIIGSSAEIDNDGTLTNNGTINYQSGTGTFTNTGVYSGQGTFQGNFINSGTLSPGSSNN
jgi:hypothetical protein